MKWLVSLVLILVGSTYLAPKAQAIVFLPALVLIPIAKIVALIIGGFAIPSLGTGALWSVLFRKSLKKTLFVVFILLLFVAILLVVVLKIYNPERPLF